MSNGEQGDHYSVSVGVDSYQGEVGDVVFNIAKVEKLHVVGSELQVVGK